MRFSKTFLAAGFTASVFAAPIPDEDNGECYWEPEETSSALAVVGNFTCSSPLFVDTYKTDSYFTFCLSSVIIYQGSCSHYSREYIAFQYSLNNFDLYYTFNQFSLHYSCSQFNFC